MTMNEKMALTVEEAAERVGLGLTTMGRLVKSGEVPSFKVGKARRVPVEGLREWVREKSRGMVELAPGVFKTRGFGSTGAGDGE